MTVTSDPSTLLGKVRLLSQDFDLANPIFQDEDLLALLSINSSDVRMAAAQALDIIAANEAYVQKRISTLDLKTDGPAVSRELKSAATELRRQVYEGDGDWTGLFDIAEMVYDEFTERERLYKQYLRESS